MVLNDKPTLHCPSPQGKASLYLHQTQAEPKETILITRYMNPMIESYSKPPKQKKKNKQKTNKQTKNPKKVSTITETEL